jgi:AcrR family transcriptional regulator
LDKAAVVQAAADLISTEGIEALTLGRLAERLGIRTPSLYNHVDGMPGLYRELSLMNVRLMGARLGDAAIGRSGAEAVMAVAQAYRAYIKEFPGLYMASLRAARTRVPVDVEFQAAEDQVLEITLAVMRSFELGREDGLHALRGLRSIVHGFATLELAGGFGLPLDCDESFRRLVDLFIRGLQHQKDESRLPARQAR